MLSLRATDMHGDMERLLYEAGVDVVFMCHNHAYERFVTAGRVNKFSEFY
jgi:hypothetical protein